MGAVPGAWTRRAGGAIAAVTGAHIAGYNGVWGVSTNPDPGAVEDLLGEVASSGLPFCLNLRPGWPLELAEVARRHALVPTEGEPLMVLDDLSGLEATAPGSQHVRQLDPDEGARHAAVAAAAFGDPEGAFRPVVTPAVLSLPGLRCYLVERDGQALATAIGFTSGDCVAIFSVATLADHRGLGYGTAVTARAIQDGFSDGATWAWLSSSAAGFPVYSRLGFKVVERCDIWELRR